MNALVRKEIRLILPTWVLAMVLATLPIWLVWPGPHGLVLPIPGVLVFAPFTTTAQPTPKAPAHRLTPAANSGCARPLPGACAGFSGFIRAIIASPPR